MYNYSSEAYELEYTSAIEAERQREEQEAEKRRSRAADEKRVRTAKVKALRTFVILAAIMFTIVLRSAYITWLCGQVSNLEEQEAKLQAVVTEKELYLWGALDQNMIEETAISRLGMKKPDQSQYIYVQMETRDHGEVISEQETSSNGFSAFINKAKMLLEYLY